MQEELEDFIMSGESGLGIKDALRIAKMELTARETCLWIADIAQQACDANDMPWIFGIIKWDFSPDMKRAAGRTDFNGDEVTITLSLPLWHKATPEQRAWVIIHEVCHVLTRALTSSNLPHSQQWRKMMKIAGAKPDIHHTIPYKQTTYKLSCCNYGQIGPRQYAKLLTGEVTYHCHNCGALITSNMVLLH